MKLVSTKKIIITPFLLLDSCLLPLNTAHKRSLRRLYFTGVCLSTLGQGLQQGGRGLHQGGVCIQGGLHLGRFCIPRWGGSASRGSTSREGLHPGGRGVYIQAGSASGGSASRGSVSRGSASRGVGQTALPTLGYYGMQSTSGRYASYWNAFLFIYLFCLRNAKPINCHFQCITSEFP